MEPYLGCACYRKGHRSASWAKSDTDIKGKMGRMLGEELRTHETHQTAPSCLFKSKESISASSSPNLEIQLRIEASLALFTLVVYPSICVFPPRPQRS